MYLDGYRTQDFEVGLKMFSKKEHPIKTIGFYALEYCNLI